jgi:uncharacterized repeat protein (TIGR01451 family)
VGINPPLAPPVGLELERKARITMRRNLAVITLFAVFALGGCGGGGGGGGGGGDKELPYVGNTSAAVITEADATRLIAEVFGIGDFTGGLPRAGASAARRLLRQAPRPKRAANQTINETEPCYPIGATEPSGYTTLTGTLDDQNGTGTVTMGFHACQDGDTFMDGDVTWRIDAALLTTDMWEPLDSTFTFQVVTMIDPELNILLGGTLRDQRNDDGSETLTLNIVGKDNDTGGMQKTENVVIRSAYGSGSSLSETISGRFYDSIDGYLDAVTNQELRYDPYDAAYPSNGQVRITGANGSRMLVTALSETMALLELDLDNDATYETSGELPWEVIAGAGSQPGDVDGDGLPDSWESTYGLSNDTYADAGEDGDVDTLSNYEEYLLGTNPTSGDSDADGMADGWEVAYGFNPLSSADAALDSDGDEATNLQEHGYGTDPTNALSTPADLAVSTGVSLRTVSAQTLFQYTLEVTNLGPGLARGVSLNDTLPPGAEIHVAVPGILPAPWECTVDGGSLTCEPWAGTLAPGEGVTIVVPVVAPAATGVITNRVAIESTTLDFAGANDTATVDTTVADAVLAQVDLAVDGAGGVDGLERPFRLAVSPDGRHIYVPGIVDDAVAVFARDLVDGTLTFVEAQRDGIDTPDDNMPRPDFPIAVAVSPDGSNVYVTTQWSDGEYIASVVAYSRDPDTGVLTYVAKYRDGVDGVDGIANAFSVTVSGDGENVYVAGPNANAVAVFDRDAGTGQLTYNAMVVDGVGGVDGLAGAFDVVLSPDDAYLYVAGSLDNAIAVFSRGSGGALSYVGVVTGVFNPQSIGVSNDGAHLYALGGDVGTLTRGLSAFARDPGSGMLTPLATYPNGENGVVGLDGMYGLAIAPDGGYVYVAATYDSGLGVFARDAATGELRFVEVRTDGVGGADGLGVAWAVAVSPDSGFVYVSASSDNALSAFRVDLNAER